MKKWVIFILAIIIFCVAIWFGIKLFKNNDSNNNDNQISNNNIIINEIEYSIKNEVSIQTDTKEEKISPNATLILKKHYLGCDHTIKEYAQMPEECVNLTQHELEGKYDEWKIEKFNPLDVTLIKDVNGFCNQHYILKEKDGVIAVYKIKENGEEELEETTGIAIEYLTKKDKEEIKQGIKVYGNEELNSLIEDYE